MRECNGPQTSEVGTANIAISGPDKLSTKRPNAQVRPGNRTTRLASVAPSTTTAPPYRIGRLMTLVIPLQVRRTVHVAQDPGVRSRQQDEPLRMGGDEVAGPVVAETPAAMLVPMPPSAPGC